MMLNLVNFEAEHWYRIKAQPATEHLSLLVPREDVEAMASHKFAYTVLKGDEVKACFGALEHWDGRAEVWAEFAADCREDFLEIHNMAKRALSMLPYRRIEATVEVGFDQAHRWIKSLGFELEAPVMRGYCPVGRDYSLYARVQ